MAKVLELSRGCSLLVTHFEIFRNTIASPLEQRNVLVDGHTCSVLVIGDSMPCIAASFMLKKYSSWMD
jgi:hypothetical protein